MFPNVRSIHGTWPSLYHQQNDLISGVSKKFKNNEIKRAAFYSLNWCVESKSKLCKFKLPFRGPGDGEGLKGMRNWNVFTTILLCCLRPKAKDLGIIWVVVVLEFFIWSMHCQLQPPSYPFILTYISFSVTPLSLCHSSLSHSYISLSLSLLPLSHFSLSLPPSHSFFSLTPPSLSHSYLSSLFFINV